MDRDAVMGYARDPWGNDRAAFSATATINREDWGLTNNMALDSGRLLVSKRIQFEIALELIHQGNQASECITPGIRSTAGCRATQ